MDVLRENLDLIIQGGKIVALSAFIVLAYRNWPTIGDEFELDDEQDHESTR